MTDQILVLYVDDEPDLLKIGKIFLEQLGDFFVSTATGAVEAIDLLKEQTFDVIISDYQMPEMDGIAFLKHLKAEGNTTPFILFTGKGREEVVIEALNNGADFYLQKGGEPKSQFTELAHKIQSAISRRRAEQELIQSQKQITDIIDFLPDATFAINNAGVVIAWNRAMEDMTGISKDEMIGQGDHAYTIPFYGVRRQQLLDLIDLDDEDIRSTYQSIQKKGNTLYAEVFAHALFGGQGAYVWATGSPLFDAYGTRIGAIESIRDITERTLTKNELLRKNQELYAAIEEIRAKEERLRLNLDERNRQELALRVNEERLRMAQNIGQTGCWEYILETNTIWGSAEGRRIFGFPPVAGDFPIDEIEACIPERDRVHQALVDLITEGREYNLEYLIHPADGSESRIVHSVARLEKDGSGTELRVMGIIQDITDRKKVEKALKRQTATLSSLNKIISTANKSDNLHQFLSNILDESLHLLDFDAGGIYLVNRSTRTADVVHSKNLPPDFLAEIRTLPIDMKPYDTLFIKNEPIFAENYTLIAPGRSKRYGFFSMASIPLISKEVAIGALNVVSTRRHVISEEEKQTLISISHELGSTIGRMTAEEDVNKTSINLQTLFNSIDEMVFVLDMQGYIIMVNDPVKKRLLYTLEDLIGINVLLLYEPDRRDEALHIMQETKAETSDSSAVSLLTKDGMCVEVETRFTRGTWNNQNVFIGVSREVIGCKKAEDALRESEELFATAFYRSPLMLTISDIDTGRYLDINDTFCKVSEYSRDEVIGKTSIELGWICPEDRESLVQELKRTGRVVHKELRLTKKDGESVWSLFSGEIISVSGRKRLLSLAEDITERKLAEQALRESEEKHRFLVEEISDPFFSFTPKGEYKFANRALAEAFGTSVEEIIGKSIWDFFPRKEADRRFASLREVFLTGEKKVIEGPVQGENRERYYVTTITPIKNNTGDVISAICSSKDISEHKRVEEQLRDLTRLLTESEEKYRALIENSHDIIYTINNEGILTFISPSWTALLGHQVTEMTGQSFQKIVHPDDIPACKVFLQTVIETGERQEGIEYRVQHLDGTWYWHTSSAVPIKEKNGTVVGFYGISHDITWRKKAEESLHESNQKLRLLIGLTRHDIYNQISAIQLLQDVALQTSDLTKVHDYISRSQKISEQVVKTIGFTREYETFGIESSDWQRICPIIESAKTEVSLAGVTTENHIPEDLEVYADPIIRKVFSTLIENSLRHGGEITNIRFSCRESEKTLILTCEDDGVGISDDEKTRIFDHGYGKHTGIGLFLAREILSITGLSIQECGEPGKGARFEISVPVGKFRRSK